jgi:hypothetical protein
MNRVRWERRARDELTNLWLQADSVSRQAITAASHRIDQTLRADPHNAGELRSGGRRVLFQTPLAVTFRIEPDGTTVSVLRVWLLRRRG